MLYENVALVLEKMAKQKGRVHLVHGGRLMFYTLWRHVGNVQPNVQWYFAQSWAHLRRGSVVTATGKGRAKKKNRWREESNGVGTIMHLAINNKVPRIIRGNGWPRRYERVQWRQSNILIRFSHRRPGQWWPMLTGVSITAVKGSTDALGNETAGDQEK